MALQMQTDSSAKGSRWPIIPKREVERSRCAGREIWGVRERPQFQTVGYDKYTFQSDSLTPKVH